MKFGRLFNKQKAEDASWRYLNYDMLKEIIRVGVSRVEFDTALAAEMKAVDDCYEERFLCFEDVFDDASDPSALRSFVVLNYLAVLKIEKKAAKRLGKPAVPTNLLQLAFCRSLVGSALFVETERCGRDLVVGGLPNAAAELADGKSCPICFEPCVAADPAHLSCGHAFCWRCLASCATAGVSHCPLCRAEQSLDPATRLVEVFLGEGSASPSTARRRAAKYDPSTTLLAADGGVERGGGRGRDEPRGKLPPPSARLEAKFVLPEAKVVREHPSPPPPRPVQRTQLALAAPAGCCAAAERRASVPPPPSALRSPCIRLPIGLCVPHGPLEPVPEEEVGGPLALAPAPFGGDSLTVQRRPAEEKARPASQRDAAAADAEAPPAARGTLTVLTWNLCAIAFPFAVPPARLAVGVLLGCDWSDASRDVPLDAAGARASRRWAQQAEYIRSSAADLVLLQEVSARRTLDALLAHLGREYEAVYVACRPTAAALTAWALATAALATAQLALLAPLVWALAAHAPPAPPLAPMGAAPGARLALALLWLGLVLANTYRWRHSCVTQYLLGSIAGQLAVLRRTASPLVAADGFAATAFQPFTECDGCRRVGCPRADGGSGGARCGPAGCSGFLRAFFGLRPRGVLRVHARLGAASSSASGSLAVLNTHLPHACDNGSVVERCAELTLGASHRAAVLFGGDLNPLPHTPLAQQLAPLTAAGNAVAAAPEGGCWDESEGCLTTWDLAQPLTRCADDTPRTMQLDFLLTRPQHETSHAADGAAAKAAGAAAKAAGAAAKAAGAASVRFEGVGARLHRPEDFFEAPLSDHTGLLSTMAVRFAGAP